MVKRAVKINPDRQLRCGYVETACAELLVNARPTILPHPRQPTRRLTTPQTTIASYHYSTLARITNASGDDGHHGKSFPYATPPFKLDPLVRSADLGAAE